MNLIEIENIQTLDEYIFALGACVVSLKTIHELQSKALNDGYLESDELEQVETIRYEVGRSIGAISSLLGLMGSRALVDIGSVAERLQMRCKESIKKLQIEQ